MTATLTETAPAKVNLTLRVIGRRADGYHELESLVAFASVVDGLTLAPGDDTSLETAGPFVAECGAAESNLVLKAMRALSERAGALKAGRFRLEKRIPVAAGLGGGSSDAAAALRLLARVNGIAPDDPRLAAAAVATGADVPVCLDSKPRIMRGVGELLSAPVLLPPLHAVLVNPRVPLPTRDVFAAFADRTGSARALGPVPRAPDALPAYLADHPNDLTDAAVAVAPVVGDVLGTLSALPGAQLARMSGSGPTCFALFDSADAAATAAGRLRAAHGNWWVEPVVLS